METHVVALGASLRGRRVVGVGGRSLLAYRSKNVGPEGTYTYGLEGLRTAQAIDNLRAFGIRSRDITVRGPRPGYVTKVSPQFSGPIKQSRRVTLVTRELPR